MVCAKIYDIHPYHYLFGKSPTSLKNSLLKTRVKNYVKLLIVVNLQQHEMFLQLHRYR